MKKVKARVFGSRILPFCLLALASWQRPGPGDVYNISDFGAKGDGVTINTRIINEVIRKCHDQGGGTVVIPAGEFISGTVLLQSDITLQLDPGAVLKGSRDTADYLAIRDDALFSEGYTHYGLIFVKDADHVAICGRGKIDGNGTYFMNGLDKPHIGHDFERKFTRQGENFMKEGSIFEDGPLSYPFRPGLLITFERCENIQLTDVYLKDSPEWTIRIGDCDHAIVRGITIDNNPLIPNNDGIHCTNSRNIIISDCNISTGDDAIIVSGFSKDPYPLPTGAARPATGPGNRTGIAENITVTNCVLSSRSACIRVGYGEHPIRNLVFSNLVMYASNRGIGIFSRNNSDIENVLFSHIVMETRLYSGHWWGKGEPIHISAVRDQMNGNAGHIKDIRFSDIIANSETGILILGSPGSDIEGVVLERVKLSIHAGKNSESYGGNMDLRPAYPVDSALFKHDIPGIYASHVDHLTIDGMELDWDKRLPHFFTNGIEVSHYKNLTIEHYSGSSAFPGPGRASIKLSDGRSPILSNNTVTTRSAMLIQDH